MKLDVRWLAEAKDQKKAVIDRMKKLLPSIKLDRNRLLVATYIRPAVSPGGIIYADATLGEDVYQGKVGLVLKCGPECFLYPEDEHERADPQSKWRSKYPKEGEYVFYNAADAWQCGLAGVPCRIIRDEFIVGSIKDPSLIY